MKEFLSYNRVDALAYYRQLSSDGKAQVNLSMPPFAGIIKSHYYESYCNGIDLVGSALRNPSLPQESLERIVDCLNKNLLQTPLSNQLIGASNKLKL